MKRLYTEILRVRRAWLLLYIVALMLTTFKDDEDKDLIKGLYSATHVSMQGKSATCHLYPMGSWVELYPSGCSIIMNTKLQVQKMKWYPIAVLHMESDMHSKIKNPTSFLPTNNATYGKVHG